MNKKKRAKVRYCYLVYCNKNPIVYAVYSVKTEAIKYAEYLIDYRRQKAEEKGFSFGFYHCENYSNRKDFDYDKFEKDIFSACLKIEEDKSEFGDHGCWIKVVRKPLKANFNN